MAKGYRPLPDELFVEDAILKVGHFFDAGRLGQHHNDQPSLVVVLVVPLRLVVEDVLDVDFLNDANCLIQALHATIATEVETDVGGSPLSDPKLKMTPAELVNLDQARGIGVAVDLESRG